jgi:hypothetical protein
LAQEAYACKCALPTIGQAMDRVDVVFSGRVVSSDRFMAQFEVEKVWKGSERSRITVLTGARDLGNGSFSISSCDQDYSAGVRYVVYASGPDSALLAPACSRTSVQSDAEVQGLDAIIRHRKLGDEVQACTAPPGETAGELRVLLSNTNAEALAGAITTLDGQGQRWGTATNASGRITFAGLPAGEYKITTSAEGFVPRQSTVSIPAGGCVEAALFLLRPSP